VVQHAVAAALEGLPHPSHDAADEVDATPAAAMPGVTLDLRPAALVRMVHSILPSNIGLQVRVLEGLWLRKALSVAPHLPREDRLWHDHTVIINKCRP
jgi:hypothetical protein